MFNRLRIVAAFSIATILSTIFLTAAMLWSKSMIISFWYTAKFWVASHIVSFLNLFGITCQQHLFASGGRCTLTRTGSSIIVYLNEGFHGWTTEVKAPFDLRYRTRCFDATDITPARCMLNVSAFHRWNIATWVTTDLIPSKTGTVFVLLAFIVSIISMTYIFRLFQKHQMEGTTAELPQLNSGGSKPLSHAAVEDAYTKRRPSSPSMLTKVWAWKSGYRVDGLGEYY